MDGLRSDSMFCVVDFVGGRKRTVVPDTWLSVNETHCLLPPKVSDSDLEVLVRNSVEPGQGWQMLEVDSLETFGSFSEAKRQLGKSKETSDAGSQRKRKKPSYLEDYATHDSDDGRKPFTVFGVDFDEEAMSENEWVPPPEFTPRIENVSTVKKSIRNDSRPGNPRFSQIQSRLSSQKENIDITCDCQSTCHSTFLRALHCMQKQLDRTNQMVQQLLGGQKQTHSQLKRVLQSQPVNQINNSQEEMEAYSQDSTNFVQCVPSTDTVEETMVPPETLSQPISTLNQPSTSFLERIHANSFKYAKPETVPVLEAVKGSDKGRKVLKTLATGNIITPNDIRELVRLVMARAVTDLHTHYPSYEQKLNIAKALVTKIPQLKNTRNNCEGYEHFYHPQLKVGMIEWRLKTMRIPLDPSKKRRSVYKKKVGNKTFEGQVEDEEDDDDDDDDSEDKINWMKNQVPSDVHKDGILVTMAETFLTRRKFILKESPPITEILTVYPRLKDYDGDLIDTEFSMMYPNAESLLDNFPSHYTSRVSKFCMQKRNDIFMRYMEYADANLSACLMLADLMPLCGLRKQISEQSGKHPSDYIVHFPGENIDVEAVIRENTFGPQPFLICEGNKTETLHFFLKLDSEVIDVGYCSMKAIDLLYKAHHVFNVKYGKGCESFYFFMDFIIYNIKKGPSKSVVDNLNTSLNMIKV